MYINRENNVMENILGIKTRTKTSIDLHQAGNFRRERE